MQSNSYDKETARVNMLCFAKRDLERARSMREEKKDPVFDYLYDLAKVIYLTAKSGIEL